VGSSWRRRLRGRIEERAAVQMNRKGVRRVVVGRQFVRGLRYGIGPRREAGVVDLTPARRS